MEGGYNEAWQAGGQGYEYPQFPDTFLDRERALSFRLDISVSTHARPVSGSNRPATARLQARTAKIPKPGTKLLVKSAIAPTVSGAIALAMPPTLIKIAKTMET